jgi:hypothetical protein
MLFVQFFQNVFGRLIYTKNNKDCTMRTPDFLVRSKRTHQNIILQRSLNSMMDNAYFSLHV